METSVSAAPVDKDLCTSEPGDFELLLLLSSDNVLDWANLENTGDSVGLVGDATCAVAADAVWPSVQIVSAAGVCISNMGSVSDGFGVSSSRLEATPSDLMEALSTSAGISVCFGDFGGSIAKSNADFGGVGFGDFADIMANADECDNDTELPLDIDDTSNADLGFSKPLAIPSLRVGDVSNETFGEDISNADLGDAGTTSVENPNADFFGVFALGDLADVMANADTAGGTFGDLLTTEPSSRDFDPLPSNPDIGESSLAFMSLPLSLLFWKLLSKDEILAASMSIAGGGVSLFAIKILPWSADLMPAFPRVFAAEQSKNNFDPEEISKADFAAVFGVIGGLLIDVFWRPATLSTLPAASSTPGDDDAMEDISKADEDDVGETEFLNELRSL
jgi:hypothetical protein